MTRILYNNRTGEPLLTRAGVMLNSDYQGTGLVNGVVQYPTGSFGSATYNYATLTVGATPIPFSITATNTNYNYSGNIQNTVSDARAFGLRLQNIISYPFFVDGSKISSSIPGVSFVVTIGAQTVTATASPSITLLAGQFVVPDTANLDAPLASRYGATVPFRLPALTDTPATLSSGMFVIYDGLTNIVRSLSGGSLVNQPGICTSGNAFRGLRVGEIVIQPSGALVSGGNALFVETAGVTAGKITATTSGTTLAIPVGKLMVIDSTAVNAFGRIRTNY